MTSKFPSVHFVGQGARDVAKKRGIKEVLYLEYDFGTRDYGAIAARIREADADLLFGGSIGVEGNLLLEALKKLGYVPRNDDVLTKWIKANPVDTFLGKQSFNGSNNFGLFTYKLKQVQNGKWQVAWPTEFAAPGAKLQVR